VDNVKQHDRPFCLTLIQDPLPVALFTGGSTGFDAFHAVSQRVVEEYSDLARRRGHRLGVANAGGQAAVKFPECWIRPAEVTAASRDTAAALLDERRVQVDSASPPRSRCPAQGRARM